MVYERNDLLFGNIVIEALVRYRGCHRENRLGVGRRDGVDDGVREYTHTMKSRSSELSNRVEKSACAQQMINQYLRIQ